MVLSLLSARWDVAEDSRRPPREGSHGGWPKAVAVGGHRGQPERKNHGKRGPRGYDAGKKVNGRKRHLVVDTLGLILMVVVHAADVQDRDGAKLVFRKLRGLYPRLKRIWADGGYAGKLIDWTKRVGRWTLEIVKRSDKVAGFAVLPKRWIVERTFGWIGRYRRMSKDYEMLIPSSEAMILIVMINVMVHRLAPG